MTVLIRPRVSGQHAGQVLRSQRQRVGTECGDARHLGRVVDQPHRQPLLRAGLGEVESWRLPWCSEMDPQGDRPLARLQRCRRELVRPPQPAGARQVGDQVQVAGLHAEVLAPPVGAGDGLAVQHRDRRIERLEHRERRHVDASDRQPDGMATQMIGERFDLRQFGHVSSVPLTGPSSAQPRRPQATRASSRSTARSRPRSPSTRSRR